MGYCVMFTYDVALLCYLDEWDNYYTAERNQHSDDGEMIMITGIREGCIEEFNTYEDMYTYCLLSGWNRPEDI